MEGFYGTRSHHNVNGFSIHHFSSGISTERRWESPWKTVSNYSPGTKYNKCLTRGQDAETERFCSSCIRVFCDVMYRFFQNDHIWFVVWAHISFHSANKVLSCELIKHDLKQWSVTAWDQAWLKLAGSKKENLQLRSLGPSGSRDCGEPWNTRVWFESNIRRTFCSWLSCLIAIRFSGGDVF